MAWGWQGQVAVSQFSGLRRGARRAARRFKRRFLFLFPGDLRPDGKGVAVAVAGCWPINVLFYIRPSAVSSFVLRRLLTVCRSKCAASWLLA